MQTIGIVAEYNPFHNGHQYHITQAKAQLPEADGVIAVMSGNFTQRGEPALFDKWTRAEAALAGGADLVLELPVAFATRSAGYFARGAVLTLAATGVVSHLSCGIETENAADTLETLLQISTLLASEPKQYQEYLTQFLREGLSYPVARQRALEQWGVENVAIVSSPNNILALEYLLTIAQEQLAIQPLLVSRAGAYHSTAIPETNQQFASATAIRNRMIQNDAIWHHQMPEQCCALLQHRISENQMPMAPDRFSELLFFLLRRTTPQELLSIIDMAEGLENRIFDVAHQENIDTIADLCMAIKSKRFTYTRLQRTMLHILLNFTKEYEAKEPAYIRVLGFNATGQKLLKEMKKTAQLPILIRPARQRNELSDTGQRLLDLDIRATNLYYSGYTNPQMRKLNQDLLRMPVQITK